jgi:hypothetical protein
MKKAYLSIGFLLFSLLGFSVLSSLPFSLASLLSFRAWHLSSLLDLGFFLRGFVLSESSG